MMAEPVPSTVHSGMILDWLETVCVNLPWDIPDDWFGPGLPPALMSIAELGPYLLDDDQTSYDQKDHCWTTIAALAKRTDRCGQLWRVLAAHLVLVGLRDGYWQLAEYVGYHERQDIQAELLEGFYTRLPVINIDRRNIAGRLIGSAKGHARTQYKHRHPKMPGTKDWVRWINIEDAQPTVTGPGDSLESCQAVLDDIVAEFKGTDHPVDPVDLELIARTRLDQRVTMKQAAAELGLDLEVAYKRRQNLERRIATLYGITVHRGSHRAKTVDS